MTIADQLTTLANTKAAIKTAIEAKGVTVGAAAFDQYSSKIAAITSGGTVSNDWVRPADWLALPSVSTSDQKIVGLFPVFNNASNGVSMTIAGAYTVDWGDGTVENFATGATASHTYSYASISDTTVSTRGYKQAIIIVTPQAGQNLTSVNLGVTPASNSYNIYKTINYLELVMSIPKTSSSATLVLGGSITRWWPYCERIDIKSYNDTNNTNFGVSFQNFYALQEITTGLKVYTGGLQMFQNCRALRKVSGFDFSSLAGSMVNMFDGCSSLVSVSDTFAGAGITGSLAYMFQYCDSLQEIPSSLAGAKASSIANFARGARSIKGFPAIDFTSATDASYAFSGCNNLVTATVALSSACLNTSYMFKDCINLREANITGTTAVTNFSYMFQSAFNLEKINAIPCNAATNVSYMFDSCYALVEIPALTWTSGTLNISGVFNACYNLAKIGVTGIANTFTLVGRLSATELNALYTNLGTVTGKTITVTNIYGVAGDDPTIATTKGWTVTGS
ncbi:BspA family leucine-rich repeat surface protein [Zoogloea sp.]|uniref:BspA family leucine-rich repeat surface protein n=1 Tax=Zoogloea sp. TaxID=49181 RepID=UPI001415E559|nr:MAG: leucine-rich repeat protein [Zoogloea sp.]